MSKGNTTSNVKLQAYAWGCQCGHLYSVADSENGAWYGRTAVDREIERLTAAREQDMRDRISALNAAWAERDRLRAALELISKDRYSHHAITAREALWQSVETKATDNGN